MAKKLTDIGIHNLKPAAVRREVPDGGCRGLYRVIQPSGRTAWAVRYRFGGKSKKLTLDGAATLAAARKAATDALHELEQGRDPAALKFAAKAEAAATSTKLAGDTVERLAEQFIKLHADKKRAHTRRQYVHVLDDIAVPAWRGRTVHDLRRRDVIDLLDSVAEEKPVMANRALAVLSKFFRWLVDRDVLAASPAVGIKRPAEEHARERVLDDDEIRRLWLACGEIGDPARACVRLLLLTGQRHSEVTGMRRSEIIGDLWTLPPARTKNKKTHTIPLSRQALTLIEAVPEIAGDYVFSTTGNAPLGHLDRAKRELDARMNPAAPWVLHDLRRTAVSGMARLGINLPVIEKIANHTSGSFRGIVGTYQRHSFLPEMRDALQRWANHIDTLVEGRKPAKVIKLGGRR